MRALLGAFGDAGHAFPMIALGRGLAARGHEVTLQTWEMWRGDVEAEGLRFEPAPEYQVFPTPERPLKPYQAAVRAARETVARVEELRADVVVADIITLAPALAGEIAGVPVATLVPHIYPRGPEGSPPYSMGARAARTRAGRALWAGLEFWVDGALRSGRRDLNEARRRLGLRPLGHLHGGLSRELCLVGTFPQLEYPRQWPPSVRVVGPLMWEPPAEDVQLPPGEGPLVLVAPSTSQDPEHRLLRAAVEGLSGEPVRVLATWNRRPVEGPLAAGPNVRLVEWVSYSRTMPQCDVVVCHAGHGTLARALASGCAVVAIPNAGDQNENAARVDWAGVGVRLPWRFTTPAGVRLAVRRAVEEPLLRARAGEMARWSAENDPADHAARLVERLAEDRPLRPM